jgi:dTDP-L-rhamnose 4-epimerase
MVLMAAKTKDISAFALRYQNVYGPGQSLQNPYTGIISIFSKLLLANSPINIFEDGFESRDFVYINDVVATTRAAIEHENNAAVESINVGNGVASSVMEVATILKKLYDSSSELNVSGNYRLGDIRHNTADITKAKEMLAYLPQTAMETGLRHFADWVSTQQISNDGGYERSIAELKEKGLFK